MDRENERTLKMKQEYYRLHFEEGLSPAEIAKRFGLSVNTVYDKLSEIAARNNVPRDSLLQLPGCGNFGHGAGRFDPVRPVDTEAFKEGFAKLISDMDSLQKTVSETAKTHEIISEKFEKEQVQWEH